MSNSVEIPYYGRVKVSGGKNPRNLYPHQREAIKYLNEINKSCSFSTLLVLPTGGGKTLTAVWWLLKAALDKDVKILWIAHRHLLLDQAAFTFQNNAYSDIMTDISSFKYRIVSGVHDKAVNIEESDNLLIAGKDSIVRNLNYLDNWLKNEKEIYLIIDEAHHAAAKSYRKIIEYVLYKIPDIKILGLTATPFRTNENEKGLLKKIFKDDIVYRVNLTDLIEQQILSTPHTEEYSTNILIGRNLGVRELNAISNMDTLPESVTEEIISNSTRNRLIVDTYVKNKDKYGQTIIFAVNKLHAFALRGLFEEEGISAGVVVSDVRTVFTDAEISKEINEENIKAYQNGELDVLINVNILTEGVDLPMTQTVFLTRPTVSMVMMTQMIGRALRGTAAGGTADAYIVSFIDDWNSKIAWVSPESLIDEEGEYSEPKGQPMQKYINKISIAKIEEFARIADSVADTTALESVDYIERIPIGMYSFSYIDKDLCGEIEREVEHSHQILVYNSTINQYKDMMDSVSELFSAYNISDEFLTDDELGMLIEVCEESYFYHDMFPSYDRNDIEAFLKYYAQKECLPDLIEFDDIERNKLDISKMARYIIDEKMNRIEEHEYCERIWNDSSNMIASYFGKKRYFSDELQHEIYKILEGVPESPEIVYGERDYSHLTMSELKNVDPEYEARLRRDIFEKSKDENGCYTCAVCGFSSSNKAFFQIDHIIPFSKGGLSVEENFQLLCRKCNRKKGDKMITLPDDGSIREFDFDKNISSEKYEEVWKHLKKTEQQGKAQNLNYIGIMYNNGYGTQKDYKKAMEYYKKAVEKDPSYSAAYKNIGLLYENGQGTEQSLDKALEYYIKSAETGDTDSMYNLADFYFYTDEEYRNYSESWDLAQKCDELGDARGANLLGNICLDHDFWNHFRKGKSIYKSGEEEALAWYTKAGKNGELIGWQNAGLCYMRMMDYEKAIDMFKKADGLNSGRLYNDMGICYASIPRKRNKYRLALECFKKAAELDDPWGTSNLGLYYENGYGGLEKDFGKAMEYQKAALELAGDDKRCINHIKKRISSIKKKSDMEK